MLLSSGPGHAQAPCEPPAARVVSIQGTVELRRAGTDVWTPAMLEEGLCIGDALRVGQASRAALALANDSTLRLDQRTTLQLRGVAEEERSLLELLFGAVYFFSHRPRALEVDTPFVNAAAEGTEFLVRVGDDRAEVVMLDGQVLLQNPHGELRVASGDAALVLEGEAPAPMIVVRPRDAVAWALYYPPILADLAGRGAPPRPLPPGLQAAIERVADNDYAGALQALETVSEAARDARYYTYLAGVLLNVGRVEEAEVAIERAQALEPEAGEALAQRAIIHVVQNRTEDALADARRGVELSPESSAARIALSYALQAAFQLEEARAVLREAVERNPEDALAWARLAELEQMFGALGASRDAAEQAVALAPGLSRTQMVLGFAALTRIDIDEAKAAFERAIALDSAEPLARLGLGLAKIRRSDLKEGRQEIEIAAALAPNDALIRSYLGKAYFEEKRGPLDARQFEIAKELDPNDPTPWFYDAIRLQTENRPVEALRNLERSIELNENRAVYRSRLLLEEDLAVRQTSLGRIYNDLGFEKRGLFEATRSLAVDPANHSAHRFLSDTYTRLPRHEIARASELLQSQLLQPININPVQPSLPLTDLNLIAGAGPAEPAFNEFTPLFARDDAQLTATGLVGSHDTAGGETVLNMLYDRFSLSAGGLLSRTDGFRTNNDAKNRLVDVYGQVAVAPSLSLQSEYRKRRTDEGDLTFDFDRDVFNLDRRDVDQDTWRLGMNFNPLPSSNLLFSLIHTDRDERLDSAVSDDFEENKGFQLESKYIHTTPSFDFEIGAGTYDINVNLTSDGTDLPGFKREQTTGYVYFYPKITENLDLTFGFSYDDFSQGDFELDGAQPKFGARWEIVDGLALRAAALETVKRALVVNQTIEPTQVAGFNQFFDDINGTETQRYGVGLDARILPGVLGGAEYSWRNLDVPFGAPEPAFFEEQNENLLTAYLYWAVTSHIALSSSLEYEIYDREVIFVFPGEERPDRVRTVVLPVGVSYFDSSGWFFQINGTYLSQKVRRPLSIADSITEQENTFLLGAEIGYRLPNRRGIFSLQIDNIFDEDFRYQDDNFRSSEDRSPRFVPERTWLARLTLSF